MAELTVARCPDWCRADLRAHSKLGASWEGMALEHVLRVLHAEPGEDFSWATHGGAELDLLLVRGERRWGFEVKYADAPRTTKSMRVALDDRIRVLALRNLGSVEGLQVEIRAPASRRPA